MNLNKSKELEVGTFGGKRERKKSYNYIIVSNVNRSKK